MSNVQTLAESFLADLDELSDDDEQEEEEEAVPKDDDDEQMDDIEALNYDDLEAVAKLCSTNRYKDIMQVSSMPRYDAMRSCRDPSFRCMKRVKLALEKDGVEEDTQKTSLEDNPTYQ